MLGQEYQGGLIPRPGQMFPPLSMEGMEWFDREWPKVRALLTEEPMLIGIVTKLDEVHSGNPFVATQPWAEPLPGGSTLSDLECQEPLGQRPASRIERWRRMFPQARTQRVLAKKGMQQRVPYVRTPHQAEIGQPRPPNISTSEEYEMLLKEVQTSIQEGIRRPVRLDDPVPPDKQRHWNLFPARNRAGKVRFCSDGSKANEFIAPRRFKERGGYSAIMKTATHKDLMWGWDVRSMFQIWPVCPADAALEQLLIPAEVVVAAYHRLGTPFVLAEHRQTWVNGKLCLSLRNLTSSFGNTSSPVTANELYSPVMSYLRQIGIRCVRKVDDGRALTRYGLALAYAMMLVTVGIHVYLGIPIHLRGDKAEELWPHTASGFDGHWMDLTTETVFSLPKNDSRHCDDIRDFLRRWRAGKPITLRELSSVKSAHASHDAHWPTPILVQPLATALATCMRAMSVAGVDFEVQWDRPINEFISLTPELVQACVALAKPKTVGTWFRVNPQPVMTVIADTSTTGCGGQITDHQTNQTYLTQQFLTPQQRQLHHTAQEMVGMVDAALAALTHLEVKLQLNCLRAVDLGTDNSATEKNLVRPGNKEAMVKPLLGLCLQARGMNLCQRSFRVPKLIHDNVLQTDWMGRWEAHWATWGITHQAVREAAVNLIGRPLDPLQDWDMFACQNTRQLPRYFSRFMDHRAYATDAMRQPWPREGQMWMFPPEILLPQVVQRLVEEELPALLVFPLYAVTEAYWPDLREMVRAIFPIPFQLSNFVIPDGTQPTSAAQTTGSTLIVASLFPRSWDTRATSTPTGSSHGYHPIMPTVNMALPNKFRTPGPVLPPSPTLMAQIEAAFGTC